MAPKLCFLLGTLVLSLLAPRGAFRVNTSAPLRTKLTFAGIVGYSASVSEDVNSSRVTPGMPFPSSAKPDNLSSMPRLPAEVKTSAAELSASISKVLNSSHDEATSKESTSSSVADAVGVFKRKITQLWNEWQVPKTTNFLQWCETQGYLEGFNKPGRRSCGQTVAGLLQLITTRETTMRIFNRGAVTVEECDIPSELSEYKKAFLAVFVRTGRPEPDIDDDSAAVIRQAKRDPGILNAQAESAVHRLKEEVQNMLDHPPTPSLFVVYVQLDNSPGILFPKPHWAESSCAGCFAPFVPAPEKHGNSRSESKWVNHMFMLMVDGGGRFTVLQGYKPIPGEAHGYDLKTSIRYKEKLTSEKFFEHFSALVTQETFNSDPYHAMFFERERHLEGQKLWPVVTWYKLEDGDIFL